MAIEILGLALTNIVSVGILLVVLFLGFKIFKKVLGTVVLVGILAAILYYSGMLI